MNNIIRFFCVITLASLVGCGSAQIELPSSSVDGAGTSGGAVSFTDPTGASIEGGVLFPGDVIIVKFDQSISDRFGDIIASMACDGEYQDLVLVLVDDTTISVNPASGKFPQKTTCQLSVGVPDLVNVTADLNKAVFNSDFEIGCDASDNFDNPRTMDRTAASHEYGDGCWRVNVTSPYSWDRYNMLGGHLVIDALMAVGEDFVNIAMLSKTVDGEEYLLTLAIDEFMFTFPDEVSNESAAYRIAIGDWDKFMAGDLSLQLFVLSYEARNENSNETYNCIASAGHLFDEGAGDVEQANAVCGDGTVAPHLGFDKQGSLYTPRYSLDGGETWEYFYDEEGLVRFVVEDLAGEVDILISASNDNIPLSELFINEVEMIGDARFVP